MSSRRTTLKIAAAALGIVAASVPIIAFNGWLKRQGENEVAVTASSALGSAEIQLGQAIAALKDLSARGVDSCRPVHLDAMRQAVLLTGPLKEVMLVAPNGQILCGDSAGLATRQQVLTSNAIAGADITIDVVRLSDRSDRYLRLRKAGKANRPGIAALVPANLLLPQASMQGGRLLGAVRMTMSDGTPVGDSGVASPSAADDAPYRSTVRSQIYPLVVRVAMPRNGVIATYDDLRRIGIVSTGTMALLILLFALIIPRHRAERTISAIAKSILAEEFVPYYQPVVDLQSGRLLGAEVLVRWRRSDGSFVEPAAFVALVESSGMALEMTRSLMRHVRTDLGEALGRRPKMTIAFNVTPQHFDDALILNDVGSIFNGSPVRLSQIVLELTERYEVQDLATMRRTIAALQGLGCKIAIDDVGTGHSGLSYILKLGVDIIKIDKIFVEAIGSEGHSKAIIETLIDLAKNMRMEIIAEGVETFDQVTYLRERGIGAAQGFVFAPPLPAQSFLQLLNAMDPIPGADVQGRPLLEAKPAKIAGKPGAKLGAKPGPKPVPAKAVKSAAAG